MLRVTSEVKGLKSELIKTKSELIKTNTKLEGHETKFEDLKNAGSFIPSSSKHTQPSDINTISSEWTHNHFFHPTDTNTSDVQMSSIVIPIPTLPTEWTAKKD